MMLLCCCEVCGRLWLTDPSKTPARCPAKGCQSPAWTKLAAPEPREVHAPAPTVPDYTDDIPF